MKLFCRVAFAGFLMFCLTAMYAQENSSNLLSATSEKTTSTNYYFARPNDLTVIVNVMGFVQRPGRYEIASSIDLMNLIALAGGPTTDGSLSKVKIIRIIKDGEKTVRQDVQPDQKTLSSFLKEEVKTTRQEIQLDLENLSTVRPEDLQLLPGDIVFVDRTTWSTARDVFSVVLSAAIIMEAISIAVRR
jgi:protein involved in polysaccharide export with SLBB domain